MKLFLSGRISGTTWRESIVEGYLQDAAHSSDWPVLINAIFGKHSYVGPYWVRENDVSGKRHGLTNDVLESYNHRLDPSVCFQAIDRADAVFAWIDSLECHGTIVELTYAWQKKKPVWAAFDTAAIREEMWFVNLGTICDDKTRGEDGPTNLSSEEAPAFFLRWFIEEDVTVYLSTCPYAEYLQSPEWAEKRHQTLLFWDNRCSICGSINGLDVHHRTYERRAEEYANDLVVLCRSCHTIFHSNSKLVKE